MTEKERGRRQFGSFVIVKNRNKSRSQIFVPAFAEAMGIMQLTYSSKIGLSACLMLAVAAGGCAIHPSTEDFSRDMVVDIVHKVRCEARDAIIETLLDPSSYLWATNIVFDFIFEMTEDNSKSADLSFVVPLSAGSFTMGFGGSVAKQRQSTQQVKIIDNFHDLAQFNGCIGERPRVNFAYPITGDIGLISTLRTFKAVVDLEPGDDLTMFRDDLKFTTSLGVSAKPSLKLTPLSGRNFIAEGEAQAARKDVHQVIIAIDPPSTPDQSAAKAREAAKERQQHLAELREERGIPQKVQLVDEAQRVLTLPGLQPQVRPFGSTDQQTGHAAPAPASQYRAPVRVYRGPSKEETLRKYDAGQLLFNQRRLLESLRK